MYRFASATTLRAGALESEHAPRARRERDAQRRDSFEVIGDGVTACHRIQDVLGAQKRPRAGVHRVVVELRGGRRWMLLSEGGKTQKARTLTRKRMLTEPCRHTPVG